MNSDNYTLSPTEIVWPRAVRNPIRFNPLLNALFIGNFRVQIEHAPESTILLVYDGENKKFTHMLHLPTEPIPAPISPRTKVRLAYGL